MSTYLLFAIISCTKIGFYTVENGLSKISGYPPQNTIHFGLQIWPSNVKMAAAIAQLSAWLISERFDSLLRSSSAHVVPPGCVFANSPKKKILLVFFDL